MARDPRPRYTCPTCRRPLTREPNAPPAYPRFLGVYTRRYSCQNPKCPDFQRMIPEAWTAELLGKV